MQLTELLNFFLLTSWDETFRDYCSCFFYGALGWFVRRTNLSKDSLKIGVGPVETRLLSLFTPKVAAWQALIPFRDVVETVSETIVYFKSDLLD